MGVANDDAALEVSATQGEAGMRAGVLHRMDLVAYAVEADMQVGDANAETAIGRDLTQAGYTHERQRRPRHPLIEHGR